MSSTEKRRRVAPWPRSWAKSRQASVAAPSLSSSNRDHPFEGQYTEFRTLETREEAAEMNLLTTSAVARLLELSSESVRAYERANREPSPSAGSLETRWVRSRLSTIYGKAERRYGHRGGRDRRRVRLRSRAADDLALGAAAVSAAGRRRAAGPWRAAGSS